MNYKKIRKILYVFIGILVVLWGIFFYIVNVTNTLYEEHHKSKLYLEDHGEYSEVKVRNVSEEWEDVKPQWKKLYESAELIFSITFYSSIFLFSLIFVISADYFISKFFSKRN